MFVFLSKKVLKMKDLKSHKGKDFFDKTNIKNQVLIISNQLITKT